MALWNPEIHPATPLEVARLIAATKGRTGGAEGEWVWGGGKRRSPHHPSLYASHTAIVGRAMTRCAPLKLRSWGTAKEGITAVTAVYSHDRVRGPESIVKVGSPPPEGSELDRIAKACLGKEGPADAEWAITRINDDPVIRFFSSVPAIAGRLIQRNAAAIQKYRVAQYSDGFGLFLILDPAQCRNPETLVKKG